MSHFADQHQCEIGNPDVIPCSPCAEQHFRDIVGNEPPTFDLTTPEQPTRVTTKRSRPQPIKRLLCLIVVCEWSNIEVLAWLSTVSKAIAAKVSKAEHKAPMALGELLYSSSRDEWVELWGVTRRHARCIDRKLTELAFDMLKKTPEDTPLKNHTEYEHDYTRVTRNNMPRLMISSLCAIKAYTNILDAAIKNKQHARIPILTSQIKKHLDDLSAFNRNHFNEYLKSHE